MPHCQIIAVLHLGSFIFLWLSAATLPFWVLMTATVWGDFRLHLALVIYGIWRYFYPRGRWERFRAQHLKMATRYQYFRTEKLVFEGAAPERTHKHMLAFHPHGLLCIGWSVNGNSSTELETRGPYTWLSAWWMNNLPGLSEVISWLRGCSCSKSHIDSLMRRGENIALLPGGFEEATIYRYGRHQVSRRWPQSLSPTAAQVYLRNRKGFIVYSLRYGYKISPVYTFGEELTYRAWESMVDFRIWLNTFKLPAAIFWSKYFLLPYKDIDLVTVIGEPIQFPLIASPTREQVDQFFRVYVDALQALFERHKGKYVRDPDATLTIIT